MQIKRTEKKFILNSQERVLAQKSIGAVMPKAPSCVSADALSIKHRATGVATRDIIIGKEA